MLVSLSCVSIRCQTSFHHFLPVQVSDHVDPFLKVIAWTFGQGMNQNSSSCFLNGYRKCSSVVRFYCMDFSSFLCIIALHNNIKFLETTVVLVIWRYINKLKWMEIFPCTMSHSVFMSDLQCGLDGNSSNLKKKKKEKRREERKKTKCFSAFFSGAINLNINAFLWGCMYKIICIWETNDLSFFLRHLRTHTYSTFLL